MRRFSALLVCALFLSSAYIPVRASYFPDVPDSSVHKDAIEFLYKLSIVEGNPNGTFAPEKLLNRAEFAKLVVLTEDGAIPTTPVTSCFKDVPVKAWYTPYVCRAKELGYMKGENGAGEYFRPDQSLNMAEILTVMDRQFEWETPENNGSDAWYTGYIHTATEKNVIAGSVLPEKAVAREQFAEIMARSLSLYGLGEEKFASSKQFDSYLSDDTVSASDCVVGELYNEELGTCQKDCTIINACADTQVAVDHLEAQITDPANKFQDTVTENVLASYRVSGENITLEGAITPTDQPYNSINTTAYHEKIWKLFTHLIPKDQRKEITSFQIVTDGQGMSLAAVQQSSDPKKWTLSVDLKDSFTAEGVLQTSDLQQTLIHEFAHILTLRLGQMRDTSTLTFPADMSDEDIRVSLKSSCKTYYDGDSCALPDSYLAAFYNAFWKNIIKTHPSELVTPPANMEDAVYAFYEKYSDQFVTDYAATNPDEDMAESFVFFVVKEKPTGTTVAEKKVQFFWNYPELLPLRSFIRNRL